MEDIRVKRLRKAERLCAYLKSHNIKGVTTTRGNVSFTLNQKHGIGVSLSYSGEYKRRYDKVKVWSYADENFIFDADKKLEIRLFLDKFSKSVKDETGIDLLSRITTVEYTTMNKYSFK